METSTSPQHNTHSHPTPPSSPPTLDPTYTNLRRTYDRIDRHNTNPRKTTPRRTHRGNPSRGHDQYSQHLQPHRSGPPSLNHLNPGPPTPGLGETSDNTAADRSHATDSTPSSDSSSSTSETPCFPGDDPLTKEEHSFRICCNQVDNMPVRCRNDKFEQSTHKWDLWVSGIQKYAIDLCGMQELGIRHEAVKNKYNIYKIVPKRFDKTPTRVHTAYNRHDVKRSRRQWGGTALVGIGPTTKWCNGKGEDPTGLGRWCWTRYQGQGGMYLRVVSVYRPVYRSNNDDKQGSVCAQHIQYFNSVNDTRDPRQALLDDLSSEITSWQLQGDQIVVMGDFNEDILGRRINNFFDKLEMHNLIFDRHSPADMPPTYSRSQTHPVDGIWGTANIVATKCGYMELGELPGDHRPLWVDISFQSAFNHNLDPPPLLRPRRLVLNNAKVEQKYTKRLKRELQKHRLQERQLNLEHAIAHNPPGSTLMEAQAIKANAIDHLAEIAMKTAERHCRRIRAGLVEYSKAIAGPISRIKFWQYAIRRRQGKHCSSKHWKRLKNQAEVKIPTRHMSIQDMEQEL